MPSIALLQWQTDRLPRLAEIDAHCVAAAALTLPNPLLAEESVRAFVVLLSGHFQGFCRDLYTECAQLCSAAVPAGLKFPLLAQFTTSMRLNSHNPTVETIRKDFERFAISVQFATEPANALRMTDLGHLNRWRNVIAHQSTPPLIGVPALTLAAVQGWRNSCDGLAVWLDATLYTEMSLILGVAPW